MMALGARVDARQPQVVVADPHLVLSTWQDVVINVWRVGATPDHVRQVGDTFRALYRAYPDGLASFSHVDVTRGLHQDATTRAAAERLTAETADLLRHRVAVIAGAGFRASAMRSMVIGLSIGRSETTRVVATTAEGALVLSKRWGRPREWAAELTGVVERTLRLP